MSSDVECPYCGSLVEIENDDYDADGYKLHEEQCPECEKTFVYRMSFSIDYHPQKADCLNGGEHRYEKTHTYPPECSRLRCVDCGHEKPLEWEENHVDE